MPLTTEDVWAAVDDAIFGVLAFSNAQGNPRTAGMSYVTDGRSLVMTSAKRAWKVRHIEANPNVSMTVTVPKRIPFLPFLKIPAATITFQGIADIVEVADIDPEATSRLFRGLEHDRDLVEDTAVIKLVPVGDFVTYGIAMPTIRMRKPELARGRVPCGTEQATELAAT